MASELEVAGFDLGAHGLDGGFEDGLQAKSARLEAKLAGGDAGEIEEVFDEAALGLDVALDDLQAVGDVLADGFAEEELNPTGHGAQRRAEFVGEGGEELVLKAVVFAFGGVDGVFDGDGGHLGELDEDGLVVVVELAVAFFGEEERGQVALGVAGQGSGEQASEVWGVVGAALGNGRHGALGFDLELVHADGFFGVVQHVQEGGVFKVMGEGAGGDVFAGVAEEGVSLGRIGAGGGDGDGLVGVDDAAGGFDRDLDDFFDRSGGVDGERGRGQLMKLGGALAEALGLEADLLGLFEQIDEDGDFGAQDLGDDGGEDVIDGAQGVAAGLVHLVTHGGEEDDGDVGGELRRSRMSWAVSKPSMPGMLTSRRTTANSWRRSWRSASRPLSARMTLVPRPSRTVSSASNLSGRSSTISTLTEASLMELHYKSVTGGATPSGA